MQVRLPARATFIVFCFFFMMMVEQRAVAQASAKRKRQSARRSAANVGASCIYIQILTSTKNILMKHNHKAKKTQISNNLTLIKLFYPHFCSSFPDKREQDGLRILHLYSSLLHLKPNHNIIITACTFYINCNVQ